jgi:hypothetical protein
MYYAIINIGAFALVGYVIYLWQKDKKSETKRLYTWLDDMFDRIGAGDIERYAFTQRIKYEVGKTQAVDEPPTDTKNPPKFVHQKR